MVLLFIRNQVTLVYLLILAAMCHGLLEYHGLKVLIHVQIIFAHQKKNELESIKRYAPWNYFPKYATNNIMKKAINKIISNDG